PGELASHVPESQLPRQIGGVTVFGSSCPVKRIIRKVGRLFSTHSPDSRVDSRPAPVLGVADRSARAAFVLLSTPLHRDSLSPFPASSAEVAQVPPSAGIAECSARNIGV